MPFQKLRADLLAANTSHDTHALLDCRAVIADLADQLVQATGCQPDTARRHVTAWMINATAKPRGHPTHYGEPMKQTAVWLPQAMIDWLKTQPGTMSDTVRGLIEQAMK